MGKSLRERLIELHEQQIDRALPRAGDLYEITESWHEYWEVGAQVIIKATHESMGTPYVDVRRLGDTNRGTKALFRWRFTGEQEGCPKQLKRIGREWVKQ